MGLFTDTYADDGKAILNSLVMGTGLGASATGMYYLAKKLRKRLDEQLEKNKPDAPDYADIPLAVPNLPAPQQKKLAFDAYTVATPLVTGGASAILAAALSDKKNKKRNALLAGLGGAAGGAALNTKPVHEAIAKSLPTGWFPYLNFSGQDGGQNYAYGGWRTIANVGGGALGVGAGKALYDIATAPYEDAEKKKENYNNVQKARQQYFDELLAGDATKKEKQAFTSEILDAAYAIYSEKKAAWYDLITLPFRAPHELGKLYSLGIAGATAGAGLIGGKYMYDKTTAASKAKNLAKAIAARERMKNSLPVWVDPQELAQVKDTARAKELSADIEV